jgi:DNA-binding NtrC family response regulator
MTHWNSKNPGLSIERVTAPEAFARRCAQALQATKGNVEKAAEALGVSRRTMTRYLQQSETLRVAAKEARGR